MVTMKDCINRVPSLIDAIIEKREETFREVYEAVKGNGFNEIYMIGSGTSNTSAQTSVRFVEEASGLTAQAMIPNPFLNKKVYNKKAIYIFTSQSGTSTLTQAALKKVKDMGCLTIAITGKKGSPLDSEADIWVDMGCGYEEYGMRTIGYCTSVFTQMMCGIAIGLATGNLCKCKYEEYITDAKKIAASHAAISAKGEAWFEANKDVISGGTDIIVYGPNNLWGVALEGALKILETAKRYISVGYEIDDGLHGPTMGFTDKHIVLIMNDGTNEVLSAGIATMMKEKFNGHGFIIGKNTMDETDCAFEPQTKYFQAIEYAPVLQLVAYLLAADYDVPVPAIAEMHGNGKRYFNTHDVEKPKE